MGNLLIGGKQVFDPELALVEIEPYAGDSPIVGVRAARIRAPDTEASDLTLTG